MKRTMMTTALAAAMLVGTVLPAAAGGPHDRATGTVTWTANSGGTAGVMTTFDAHDGAPGAKPDRGSVITTVGDSTVWIDLTCVRVSGDQAWMGGVAVAETGDRYSVGEAFVVWVKDDGTPSANDETYEIGQTRLGSVSMACDQVAAGWTGKGYVTSGNLQVFSSDS
jgi:hypothetical protein